MDPIGLDVTEPRLSWRMDDLAHPGCQQFLIHPVIPGDLTHARASTESPTAPSANEWTRADGHLKLEIPPNSSATLRIVSPAPLGSDWHVLRLSHRATGEIGIFVDDMETPVMTANDTRYPVGRMGFGTFDDPAEFRSAEIVGERR